MLQAGASQQAQQQLPLPQQQLQQQGQRGSSEATPGGSLVIMTVLTRAWLPMMHLFLSQLRAAALAGAQGCREGGRGRGREGGRERERGEGHAGGEGTVSGHSSEEEGKKMVEQRRGGEDERVGGEKRGGGGGGDSPAGDQLVRMTVVVTFDEDSFVDCSGLQLNCFLAQNQVTGGEGG